MIPHEKRIPPNPYLEDLCNALNMQHTVVNMNRWMNLGVFDIILYLKKADVFYFNFIEDLYKRKYGLIQFIAFPFIVALLKLFRKKIIWTKHDVSSHSNGLKIPYKIIDGLLENSATTIVIHTEETYKYISEKRHSKCKYIFHPFNREYYCHSNEGIKYDVLIWGAMQPYKGILEFVQFYQSSNLSLRIKIIGFFASKEYYNQVKKHCDNTINLEDRFVSKDELRELHEQSKYVLFTYNGASVLNSAALVESLSLGNCIIGPNVGAFKELKEKNLVLSYDRLNDIYSILTKTHNICASDVADFIKNNSWSGYSNKLFG